MSGPETPSLPPPDSNGWRMAQSPLQMPEIVHIILSWLDLKSLKNARGICRLWGHEGGKLLLPRSVLRLGQLPSAESDRLLTEDEQAELAIRLQKLLELVAPSTELRWRVDYKAATPTTIALLKNKHLDGLAGRITTLRFKDIEYSHLWTLLNLLPNLRNLHTGFLCLNPRLWWITPISTQESGDAVDRRTELEILLKKLEALQELRLNFPLTHEELSHFLPHHERLRAITKIHPIDSEFSSGRSEGAGLTSICEKYLNSGVDWPLTRFALDLTPFLVDRVKNRAPIRSFLEKISPTLTHLKLNVQNLERSKNWCIAMFLKPRLSKVGFKPWVDNYILPLSLVRLHTLKITGEDPSEGLMRTLVWAIQLEGLKILEIKSDIPPGLNEVINLWNTDPRAVNGLERRQLISRSVEQLDLVTFSSYEYKPAFVPVSSSDIVNSGLWPNLKALKFKPRGPKDIAGFSWATWKNSRLERLELDLGLFEQHELPMCKKWLGGFGLDGDPETPGPSATSSSSSICLKDLKDLKSLKIQGNYENCKNRTESGPNGKCCTYETSEASFIVNDEFVYGTLVHLRGLQSLHIDKHSSISERAAADLKKVLGDHVDIRFLKGE